LKGIVIKVSVEKQQYWHWYRRYFIVKVLLLVMIIVVTTVNIPACEQAQFCFRCLVSRISCSNVGPCHLRLQKSL